jgi:hypothetical protein
MPSPGKVDTIEPLAKFMRITGPFEATVGYGELSFNATVRSCFFAETQADFSTFKRHLSLKQLTKLRPALSRSANQLEQLVGKQDHDAKREVEPDLLGAPHHDVVTTKLFLQAAVKTLRHRPLLVPGRLMGRQRDTRKPSLVARVVGRLYTALATKALAMAWRFHGFRPNLRAGRPTNLSIWTTAKMLTNGCSLSGNGRFPHASRPGIKFRCKVPINHDTASLSFIGASLCFRFFSQNHLSTGEPMRLIFSINQPEQDFCKRLYL